MTRHDPFKNRHRFQDDIWGQIRLNDLERDIIDTPEFQRLFRTSQMGFVELVYHTANHTRGAHSIGACRMAVRLMDRLVENTTELHSNYNQARPGLYADFVISPSERILIRLGALLHDISHVPFSHDLERKSHKIFYGPTNQAPLTLKSWNGHYPKHDDYLENPILFYLLRNDEHSVLSRVLKHYSAAFWDRLRSDAQKKRHHHLKRFVDLVAGADDDNWAADQNLLPDLVFHLLIFEQPSDAKTGKCALATSFDANDIHQWHLGPASLSSTEVETWHRSWYQPFRHDIIGNTLSSDLIDYLTRDPDRLGTVRRVDLHLLSHYALVNPNISDGRQQYRCAIDLHDYKRGTTRMFLLNDLFRLLDLRQDIHEKAVMHRVVQSANAMLGRALLLLGKEDLPLPDRRPTLSAVAGLNSGQEHALQSEDILLDLLLGICDDVDTTNSEERRRLQEARRLFVKLAERRIYRPIAIIPGNVAKETFHFHVPKQIANTAREGDFKLRTLAALADSAYYSPFLFFACACVEKYLSGAFDAASDVSRYVDTIVALSATDKVLHNAMTFIPSRVITCAAPYKQLYKDPAIVVALDDFVDQVDHIVPGTDAPDPSTRQRIEAAIQDADSKYEGLWQLYVFISDGLYYSGLLQKLFAALPPELAYHEPRDNHKLRLENSQALLSLAFKAICNNWAGQDQRLTTKDEKAKLLETRMPAEAFKEVLRVWVTLFAEKSGWETNWVTVDVMQYYHEFSLDKLVDDRLKRPCRDARYKFDRSATPLWEEAVSASDPDSVNLIGFLRRCSITDPELFSEGEFRELIDLYKDERVRTQCDILLSAPDRSAVPNALKALWLAGFPMPEQPVVKRAQVPGSREEIGKWIQIESRILRPNVRRKLCEDLEPIIDIVHWASALRGSQVFDDFHTRLDNESKLIWNDVRSGRIRRTLQRRWGYPQTNDSLEEIAQDPL